MLTTNAAGPQDLVLDDGHRLRAKPGKPQPYIVMARWTQQRTTVQVQDHPARESGVLLVWCGVAPLA